MANAASPQSESRNIMIVDYANNPSLASVFAGKEIGGKCKLEVELRVINKTPDQCTLSIEKIITENYDAEEETEIEPSVREPVMISMRRRKGDKEPTPARAAPTPMSTGQPTVNSLGTTSYA